MSEIFLPHALMAKMLFHLEGVLPEEGCGLLAGTLGKVERVFTVENILHSPVRFEMEPFAQVNAMIEMEHLGLELLAIFHSHPNGPNHPSETDTRLFYYPEAASIICWRENKEWRLSAYRMVEKIWQMVELTIS